MTSMAMRFKMTVTLMPPRRAPSGRVRAAREKNIRVTMALSRHVMRMLRMTLRGYFFVVIFLVK